MKKIDTFSVNSLKILDRSKEEFVLKYEENLFLSTSDKNAKAGQNLHSFLSYYLSNLDTAKIEASFGASDKAFIEKIKSRPEIKALKAAQDKRIETPFFVKCDKYWLTGRFDAVLFTSNAASSNENNTFAADTVQIFDWKTTSLPKDVDNDLQTIVYLYSAQKLHRPKNLELTYVSLSKNETATAKFASTNDYEAKIIKIIEKYYKE